MISVISDWPYWSRTAVSNTHINIEIDGLFSVHQVEILQRLNIDFKRALLQLKRTKRLSTLEMIIVLYKVHNFIYYLRTISIKQLLMFDQ